MYTPLYIKTDNSLLSSLIKIDDLIKFAKENNIKSLTITDNKMYGAYEFYKKCISNNIKPIIGLEVNISGKVFVLYAKNYDGYRYLLKVSSIKEITYDDLDQSSDLICIIPFMYSDIISILNLKYNDIFIGYKDDVEEGKIEYPNKIYMKTILCLNKNDNIYLRYIESIRSQIPVNDISSYYDNHLVLFEEVKNKYPKHLSNNFKIFDMCDLKIINQKNLLPEYVCPDNLDSYSYLKKLCIKGLKRIFGETVNVVYQERLKKELEIINRMGFCNYFLIVWDYVNFANKCNILVGPGRGSACGSLVSYLLGITKIDPIKYNLLFERFLNPERVTMPDIDIDFEYNRREEIVNYCIKKYGEKSVAPIISFGTLASKQAIRDVSRTMNIPLKTVDRICNLIDSKKTLRENYNNIKIKDYLETDKSLIKLYKVASKLEGLKRNTSIHASGIVISGIPLDLVIPLDTSHDFYITAYSMEYLEEQGLLKMDLLALKNLTLINDILNDAGVMFDEIKMNDEEAIKIFNTGDTLGIFQFESLGMINFLKKFNPTNFEDIVACIALYRPGPMDNIDTYINRKKGLEKISYITDSLKPILSSTYGIIVYQEQIMLIAQIMASYTLGEADILRRAMSKKKADILISEKKKFINRSIDNGYDSLIASQVYDLILKFASYGFNRAHSVAYAVISYKMAFLKAHYRIFFMKHLLSYNYSNELKTREYIYECKKNNIGIIKPSINVSDKNYIIKDNNIIFPLVKIKGVSILIAQEILRSRRDGLFIDIFDFIKRNPNINKGVFENLVFAGCFDEFGFNKRTLIENMESIINYSELGEFLDYNLKPIINVYDEYDNKYLMEQEMNLFGLYLSSHPITNYKKRYGTIDLKDIYLYFDKVINVVAYVDRIKELDTKKGEKMCFVTGTDEISEIDIVFFPRNYDDRIRKGDIIYINGKIEKRFDKFQIIVNKILDIFKN
ncbi:MAG: DNA polymerase III subunit alpha [Bacilli bacterium]|nr:DNA polymerase III subunit alpha [Bacilli bacterium]